MAQHKTIDRRAAKQKATPTPAANAGREHKVIDRRQAWQKQTVTVPTAPARGQNVQTGGYYSPREYGAQTGSYEARVTAARAEMEQRSEAMRQAQRALEQLNAQAEERRKRYYELSGTFEGDTAAEYEQRILDDWTEAVDLYDEGRQKYEQEYAAYKPYEDAYNAAVGEYNAYVSAERAEYDRWRGSIRGAEEIRAEQKKVKEARQSLVAYMGLANQYAEDPFTAPDVIAANEAKIRELQEYLGGVGDREKLLAEELDWSEHFRFEDLRKNGDFGQKSRFTGVDNQGDRVYQYVNGNPNAVSGSIDALLDRGTQDDLLLKMMGGNDGWRDIIGYNETPAYLEHMTEDEKAMYNYVYSTQGREAAQGYLDHLKPELTARKTGTVTKFWRMLAGQNAVTGALYSGLSVPMNAAGGIQAGLGQVASALRGEELDPNASYNLMANTKNAIRDEVSGKIQEHAGPVGSFAYGTVMSMADMAMDAAAGNPAAATALIGTRAFSEQVIDSKNRGLSDEQALTMGITSAFAELVTEKLGLDELLHLPDKWATAGFWKGAARGAGGEALEEGLTNLMNLAADISIAGENSEFMHTVRALMQDQYGEDGELLRKGMTKEEATGEAVAQALMSFGLDVLGGALSGGAFGGYRGWRGKRAADAQEKKEGAAQAQQEEAPSVSEADSSPIPDGTGEPLGDDREGRPYAADNGTTTSDNRTATSDNRTATVAGEREEPDAHLPGPEDFVGKEGEYPGGAEAWLRDAREGGLVVDAEENGGKINEGEYGLSGAERHDAPGAGAPVGGYAEHRERQQAEARSQTEAAAQRRVKAENLERLGKAQRVSSKDLGLKQGTEVQELLELPRYEWDGELWDTVSRIEKETGYKVRTVTGNIGVRLKGGGVGLSRGYIDRVSGTIVMNVAHTQVTAGQIADHELWHWKMDAMNRVGGDRYEMTRAAVQRIQEEYDPEDFDAVLDKYIDGYGDVYDMDAPDFLDRIYEEIMADAYAGINAFGADTAKYRSTVDAVMAENGMGRNVWNAQEQEDYLREETLAAYDSAAWSEEPGADKYAAIRHKLLHANSYKVGGYEFVANPVRGGGFYAAVKTGDGKVFSEKYSGWREAVDGLTEYARENELLGPDAKMAEMEYDWSGFDENEVLFSMEGGESMDSEGRELTAEQQAFFRDSKVRDEQGRLMVVHHGTNGSFTEFNARDGLYWFSRFEDYAESMAEERGGDKVIRAYLNVKKPYEATLPPGQFSDPVYERPIIAEAKERGYDGVIINCETENPLEEETFYVAFHPGQIKSVDNTTPTNNPDIRFSMEGSLSREEYERLAAEVAGDQSKRNEEFVKSKLTPEQYKQYKAFAREDRLDQEAEARVRGIERFEEAQAREDMAALRAQQAEDAAAGRRELAAEEKAARAEAREKAGTAREERKRKTQEKREKLRQEAKERIRQAAENAPTDSAPTIARKELQDKLIGLFSVGEGQRGELRREIGQLADRMIAEGTVDERDLRRLIDRLYESGVMVIEPEKVYAEGRSYLKDEHIYISPEQIRELGDDWLDLRKKAWGLGVYLTTDRSYAGLDVWNADMASYLPGLFNENETDSRTILERLLHIAQEGKAEKVSLPEYTKRIAKQEHQSEEALLYNMERQVEEALRTFGEKASLEMRLKNRNARRRAMDREEAAIVRENERTEREQLRQDLKDERAYLKEQNEAERDRLRLERAENDRRNAAERRRLAEERAARRRKHQEAIRKKELRELQEKTLKALQWISKNRRKAPEAMQEAFNAVLGNIDLYAISMADEMNWSSKYGATWKDLKQMYNHARTADPNFIPSEDLQKIVDRLDSVQLESMDFDQLRDLYQAAVGLRTEFYQRNNVIGSEEHEIMGELYNDCVEEMRTAPKKLKGMLDRFLNLEQMTPMNVFEEMGGFNPDGALYKFAQQLEAGERKVRSFKVRSNKILADFLEDNADWIHKADGQGKDGIWIEKEIPQLIGMKVGEIPEFGGTVKVCMTPMQRVHLYLESRNYDNLRHMTGGRTFADRELYSQGKREEAFAKGTTIRMAPETVQLLVKDMSPEEMELARLLDKYYNDLAATEINKVSNVLLGYNKAMGGHYAPIFTDKNYTESEFGRYDCTAEGAGNLKERNHYSKVPSYNISALDAFERNMDRTATYVGMAIPSRNWATLMKWKAGDSSFKAEIDHTWGPERKKYIETLITDLQNPMGEQQDMVTEMSGKLLSNYISSVFGFNPSIVAKQLGSIPMASAYLDWKYFPKKFIGKGKINRELIGRYTQELDWRTMGYSMPETKQLKDAPNWSQKNKVVGLVFGGDAITAMDGWAASVLWPWAENKVRAEFPGLEVGDAAMIESGQSPFYQKVAELFNDAVSRSQSVSDQMHQGRLRKSKHAAAKAVTMFRSDSAQSYNVLRQRLGELDYYRRQGEGGKEKAEAAKKAVGAAATAVLINRIWGTTVDLLVKAMKGKLDEEDKEPLQIAEDFFWGVIDSYAGMVTVGDIVAETVGNWFTGEMRFDQEAPGVEQFNDILQAADKIINAGKKGNLIGAIKIGAETVASYGFGLPTKNVEAYLMGLFSWALPGAKVAYEDLLKAPAKADLKGLEGKALTARLNHVLKGYGVELEPEVREALAALYEAGYTEAVPSAAPDAVTVDGVELGIDGRMKKEYDKTRGGIIEQELPEITGSAFFDQADEKTRKAMVTKLYSYAAEKAKEAVLEGYAIGTTAQAIDEIVRSGGSAADYAVFDAVTVDMAAWQRAEVLREWGTDEAVTGLMFKHLVSKSWEDEQAELRKVGVDVGRFLELYAMHGQIDTRDLKAGQKATEFAYWLDGQRYTQEQKAVIEDQMAYFQMMPAEAARYSTATAAGLDREQALELTEELDALEPPEGKTSVQQIQKWRVGIDNAWAPENQLQQLKAVGMDEKTYAKCEALWDAGVAPAAYVRAQEIKSQYDSDGNGNLTNEDWRNLINSMVPSGIVLPGDNERFNLTSEQMGFLWQMLTGNKSTKNNPFSKTGGEKWLEIKNKDK